MDIFEIIGATIGLFYIVSEYRANRWFWPCSLLMSAFYAVIEFASGIYANGIISCYNFLMSVYGLLVWRGILLPSSRQDIKTSSPEDSKSRSLEVSKSPRQISSCPRRYRWQILVVIVLLSVVLTWVLDHFNQSIYTLPSGSIIRLSVLDGVSSALTIVGMAVLALKWWQHWLIWIVVEPLMIVIFMLTGNYASAGLYVVFEVFCILGIIKWRKESIS